MKKFTDRLESLREGLTQKAFAEKLNVPLNTYTAWLRGERLPSYEAIERICTVLCVSSDWLLGLSQAPPTKKTHAVISDKPEDAFVECQECKKKQSHIDRLERIIDKLTK